MLIPGRIAGPAPNLNEYEIYIVPLAYDGRDVARYGIPRALKW